MLTSARARFAEAVQVGIGAIDLHRALMAHVATVDACGDRCGAK